MINPTIRMRKLSVYITFVSPAVFFFSIVIVYPFLRAILYSFQDWNGLSTHVAWAGWRNYVEIFNDGDFWGSVAFTSKYVLVATVLLNTIAFFLALILNLSLKSKSFLRTAFFLPYVIGPVIIGFIWQFIIGRQFVEIGEATGWPLFMQNWLALPQYAFWSLVLVTVWQSVGYYMVIYLAALQGVPNELLEAAEIDGAGRWMRLWKVILPLIRPAVTICIFLAVSNVFKAFDLNYSLTRGGPYGSTETLALHIYTEAFANNLFTYGAAKSVLFFVIVAMITTFQVMAMKRKEVEL